MSGCDRRAAGIAAAVERARSEISADIADGVVPDTIGTFEELHNYVDANEYGGLCETAGKYADVLGFDDTGMANVRAVQDQLDEWLRGGRQLDAAGARS